MNLEHNEYRCCLCPCKGSPSSVCPGIKDSILHPNQTPCGFTVTYRDENGYIIFVNNKLYDGKFMSYRRQLGSSKRRRVKAKALPVRRHFDDAQSDLNKYAKIRGWQVIPNVLVQKERVITMGPLMITIEGVIE